TFVWRRSGAGTVILNETSATLTIDSAQSGNAGSYTVEAVNAYGSDTSAAALLTVNGAPTITMAPPAFVQVDKGTSVTLEVQATGATTYQWKLDGSVLTGETESTLTIDAAQPANAGVYTVVVGNNCDSVETGPTQLAIRHLSNAKFANGKFGFKMDGEANEMWIFQVSTDLKNWVEVGRVTLDMDGIPTSATGTLTVLNGRVTDTGSDSTQTTRMYRIRKQ
ncbi:immunoglobulin domain-containing protein, partial [Verrucomicrobia bacterium]|nr:immunoglobulin domain-containing protein [Verrucomicrobiota bacterium]